MGENLNRERQLSEMFKALGDPARLRIFEFLCSSSSALAVEETGNVRPVVGLTVGEVCCQITGEEKVTSTVSQQLKQLRHAGLITMVRRGKNMICAVNREALAILAAYMEECEKGAPGSSPCEC